MTQKEHKIPFLHQPISMLVGLLLVCIALGYVCRGGPEISVAAPPQQSSPNAIYEDPFYADLPTRRQRDATKEAMRPL